MESIYEFSERIVRNIKENDMTEEKVANNLSWFLNDVFALIKNIDQTSLNSLDRAKRLIDAEQKYGIPKTHLILK